MTVTDLDSGSQGRVECRLESDDDVTRNSFSLHRYQSDSDHFRSVRNNRQVCQRRDVNRSVAASYNVFPVTNCIKPRSDYATSFSLP